jgi:hypothetical protein
LPAFGVSEKDGQEMKSEKTGRTVEEILDQEEQEQESDGDEEMKHMECEDYD